MPLSWKNLRNVPRVTLRACIGQGLALLLLMCLLWCSAPASAQVSDTDIKAALIYKFALFVEWPEGTYKAANSRLVIGVVDSRSEALVRTIENIVQGKNINGRAIDVRRLKPTENLSEAQILFIAAADMDKVGNLRQQIGNSPVLTIGESPRFVNSGGILNFYIDNGSVRFEVNPDGARRARLSISPQVLRLGRAVKEKG